jgi:hypothetical protein
MRHRDRQYAVTRSQSSCYFALCIACSPLRVTAHYQAHDLSSQDAELTHRLTSSLCLLLHSLMPERLARDIFLPVGSGVSERAFDCSASRYRCLFCISPHIRQVFRHQVGLCSLLFTPLRGRSECTRVARPRACYLTHHQPFPLISRRRRQLFRCTARINLSTGNKREWNDD